MREMLAFKVELGEHETTLTYVVRDDTWPDMATMAAREMQRELFPTSTITEILRAIERTQWPRLDANYNTTWSQDRDTGEITVCTRP